MFTNKTLFALTAIASLAIAGSANAGEFESNGRTAIVRYNDINLAEAAGQKELQRRIRAASVRVCTSSDRLMMQACTEKARDHVKAPVANAIARATTGERYADAQVHVGK